ncbi:MAG: tetratricopeptide repeat protein [Proteobacteria bacterium]|nr:tetratricopeptide repeat protein [Pseudomonadota bacterium]
MAPQARARTRSTLDSWLENGEAAHIAGRYEEASSWFRRVLDRDPANFDALQLLGGTRLALGQLEDGVALLRRALKIDTREAMTHNNLGNALLHLGRRAEAVVSLRTAANLEPGNGAIALNLGNALRELGDLPASLATVLTLLQREPKLQAAHFSLGLALRAAGRPNDALIAFERAIALDPLDAHAHAQCGLTYADLGDSVAAFSSLGTAAALAPENARSWMTLLKACAGLEIPDWATWTTACEILSRQDADGIEAIDPMRAMLFPIDDAGVARITRRYTAANVVPTAARRPRPALSSHPDGRIRLGYLSPDFGDHPVCRLIAPALQAHDRAKFSVTAYAWGSGAGTPHRANLEATVDRCIDVSALSDIQVAELLRADGIDIAVDLAGYTGKSRPRILLDRPAPIQVGWLGYPGTLGTDALDYLIADTASIPHDAEQHFSERIARLPHGFLPYDTNAQVAPPLTRAQMGLPTAGIVFACFSQTRKLNPLLFDLWMQALQEVPDSILWLAANTNMATDRLRAQAAARGIDSTRLVVSPRAQNQAEYLARYAIADLALDTYPYGSHSTALDVLWAGCPLLALRGPAMASRVSSSILTAAGIPNLIQQDPSSYLSTMVALAKDCKALADLRARVHASRQSPLFDLRRLVTDLERAYLQMHAAGCAGQLPASFDIAATP